MGLADCPARFLLRSADYFVSAYPAEEREWAGLVDLDGDCLADEPRIAVEHDDMIGHRPAGQLLRAGLALPRAIFAEALDQYFDRIANAAAVIFEAVDVLNGEQVVIPAL